jgi:NSS family neurotransmitter:Na+ symporter
LASIIIGLAVIPTVFALSDSQSAALTVMKSGNQGLTFIFMPQLFSKMTGGFFYTLIFFFALFIASISSLIAMQELAVKVLGDYRMARRKAIFLVSGITLVAGIPSAYSLKVFNNQDWVWGLGLLLSGLFFIFFVIKYGIRDFKNQIIDAPKKSLFFRREFLNFIFILMFIEFLIMFIWWLLQSLSWYPETWWDPFAEFTIGTCLLQWLLIISVGLIFNKRLSVFERV